MRSSALRLAWVSFAVSLVGAVIVIATGSASSSPGSTGAVLAIAGFVIVVIGIAGVGASLLFGLAADLTLLARWFRSPASKTNSARTATIAVRESFGIIRRARFRLWLPGTFLAIAIVAFVASPMNKNPIALLVIGAVALVAAFFVIRWVNQAAKRDRASGASLTDPPK